MCIVESKNRWEMSRGLRNHNPGNIRRSVCRFRGEVLPSTDPAFKQFEADEWGYRAIFVVLRTYWRKHHLRTLSEMIARWAPPSENDTARYIRSVTSLTGIAPNEEIDPQDRSTMIPLVAAISQVENGRKADWMAVERGWELYLK